MLEKLKKAYLRAKTKGYLGGVNSIFKEIQFIDEAIVNNQNEDLCFIEVGSERGVGSTYYLAKYCAEKNLSFYTIDPSNESNKSAKKILNKFKSIKLQAVKARGEDFLNGFDKQKIVLAYLDGFDVVFPGTIHSQERIDAYASWGIDLMKDGNRLSADVHLETTKYIYRNVVKGGIIAFDDTYFDGDEWFGKGKTGIPFLLENGYELVNNKERARNHSVLLKKL